MAFRKRNVAVNNAAANADVLRNVPQRVQTLPGTKPSLLTANIVTSTGTAEFDGLLGGHGGLILGSSVLIGEHGTTDYAGALLRAFVAEGLLQGHHMHIIGADKSWTQNLPGIAADIEKHASKDSRTQQERMKIAWRYESLEKPGSRGLPLRPSTGTGSSSANQSPNVPFCHTFDLTKRLAISPEHKIEYMNVWAQRDALSSILERLSKSLSSSTASTVHRIAVPLLLSPLFYPGSSTETGQVLHFMHGLRALLSKYASSLVAMISIPLTLYPRSSGMVRWLEHLSDGVVEMTPFPYVAGATLTAEGKGDTAQGMLKVAKLPCTTDRGEGGAGAGNTIGDDLAFTLSRRKFVIEPFSLPPVEGDQEAQQEAGKITAKDVEF